MLYRLISGLMILSSFAAFSSSSHYQLKSYGVNSGGTDSSSSTTYKLQGSAGEIGSGSVGATYQTKSGSIQAQQTNVPGAPTLDNNGGGYFNQLKFTLDTQNNPSDTIYDVAVSTTSNFAVTNYVQADGTLNTTPIFQTYSLWGGASGSFAIGLSSSTTYYFKVAAMQGQFTATGFGPSANIATGIAPTLSFSMSPSLENMGNLNAGSVINSPSDLSFTYSSSATNGGNIYVAGNNTGLVSAAAGGYNIHTAPPSADLGSATEGFGLQGITASAPLAIQSPYNGSSNVVGAIYTTFQPLFSSSSTVSSGTATARIKAKASATTPSANDYTVTLTFIAAADF